MLLPSVRTKDLMMESEGLANSERGYWTILSTVSLRHSTIHSRSSLVV